MDKNAIYQILARHYFAAQNSDEQEVLNLLRPSFRRMKFFVDVGASLGQYTKCAATIMTGGKILAVEADPVRYEELARNAESWQATSRAHLTTVHAAVSNSSGAITFHVTDSPVSGSLVPHEVSDSDTGSPVVWRPVKVPTVRLDELFPDEQPDLVKVDVEGAELLVAMGATRLLEKGHSCFLIELHPWSRTSGADDVVELFKLFSTYGFVSLPFAGKTLFLRRRPITRWTYFTCTSFVDRLVRRLRRRGAEKHSRLIQ